MPWLLRNLNYVSFTFNSARQISSASDQFIDGPSLGKRHCAARRTSEAEDKKPSDVDFDIRIEPRYKSNKIQSIKGKCLWYNLGAQTGISAQNSRPYVESQKHLDVSQHMIRSKRYKQVESSELLYSVLGTSMMCLLYHQGNPYDFEFQRKMEALCHAVCSFYCNALIELLSHTKKDWVTSSYIK
ncbi:hypothetical protein BT93_C0981 [Corymbia citriodora subsp. variegata]|nr:hypothetical protein BT93_C0981 [Corymbia citriodora subsp. variegata]